jgi:hypothetical protein
MGSHLEYSPGVVTTVSLVTITGRVRHETATSVGQNIPGPGDFDPADNGTGTAFQRVKYVSVDDL